jgi:endonuclease-3
MIQDTTKVICLLAKRYTAKGMVDLGNPEDTLIATLLSARTRDEQVVKIYPDFRKAFPRLKDLATADARAIAKKISSVNFFRNKSKAIKALASRLVNEFHGCVPETLEELITLPGVGRKTASCVMWYGFGKPAMAVDTHVFRITRRLGWAKGKNPEIVEQELMKLVPEKLWGEVNRSFIHFGRDICKPQTPQCWKCPVEKWCAYKPKTKKPE